MHNAGAPDVPNNPFSYGHVATGEHFTDRARELQTLVADVSAGQSVVIVSPRRFGKTSRRPG